MNKIEFSDVYKFIASIGLVAIGFAFLIPWGLNKDISILLIESDKLKKLTPTAITVINRRQDKLLFVDSLLPFISVALILIGIFLLIWSISTWKKRQIVIDNIQDEELKNKRMSNMSFEQIKEKIKADIGTIEVNDSKTTIANKIYRSKDVNLSNSYNIEDNRTLPTEENINYSLKIINDIYENISSLNARGYETYQYIKINDIELDIFLKSDDRSKRDIIIEVRIFKNRSINLLDIKNDAHFLAHSCKEYSEINNSIPLGILLIVHSDRDSIAYLKELKADVKIFGRIEKQRLSAHFIKIDDVKFFDPSKLIEP